MKRNAYGIMTWLPVALAVLLALGVMTVFRACGPKEDGAWMHCHSAQMGSALASGIVAILLAGAGLAKNRTLKAALYALAVLGCGILFLIPGTLVSMCMMRSMRCYTHMQPFVRILAAVIAVFDAYNGFRALRGRGMIQ